MRPQDDTQLREDYTQFATGNTETTQENAKTDNARAAKIAAGVGAAAILGTGAAYAANEYFNGEEATGNAPATPAAPAASAAQPAPAAQPAAHHHHHPAHHPAHHHHHPTPKPTDNAEPKFLKENEVEIKSIETQTTDDGETVHLATGTVDGHQAMFVDDGTGNVQAAVVDFNDNSKIDDGEVIDMKGSKVTMQNLAAHLDNDSDEPITAKPVLNEEPDVEVIKVENDVDMNGQNVNVAVVAVNEEPVVFVDTNQNGEVNIAAADVDSNGSISDNEIVDVTDHHIPMPTAEDVSPQVDMVQNDMPDYSNDSDITTYEV